MFIREILRKFTWFTFWKFGISLALFGRFQNFKKVNSVNLSQIFLLSMWLLAQISRFSESKYLQSPGFAKIRLICLKTSFQGNFTQMVFDSLVCISQFVRLVFDFFFFYFSVFCSSGICYYHILLLLLSICFYNFRNSALIFLNFSIYYASKTMSLIDW